MNQTHINIVGNNDSYKYVIEYIPLESGVNVNQYYYDVDGRRVDFYNEDKYLKRVENDWYNVDSKDNKTDYLPSDSNIYKTAKVRIYYPEYSINTYTPNQKYILTANTWIMNKTIYLGSFILDRSNALACPGIKIINGEKYLEYQDFDIIDPFEMAFSDKWVDFRKNVCGEVYILPILNVNYVYELIDILKRLYPHDFNLDYNNDYNNLYEELCRLQYSISEFAEHENEFIRHRRVLNKLSDIIIRLYSWDFNSDFCNDFNIERKNLTFAKILQIIQKFEPSDFNRDYNKDYAHIDIPFNDGSDSLVYNDTGSILNFALYPIDVIDGDYIKKDGYTGGHNSINITNNDDYLKLIIKAVNEYNTCPNINMSINFNKEYENNLKFYLYETYGIISNYHVFEMVIKDKDNIYYGPINKVSDSSNDSFNKFDIHLFKYNDQLPLFESMDQFIDGCSIACSVTFLDEFDQETITITSNEIPLTIELYSYLCKNQIDINNIDINSIDMNIYNISAVNKVVNEVIHIENSTSNNNVISPVFFRASEVGNIVLHPEVTENICINLDSYKSKVNTFSIQIEGIVFPEMGRVSNGVLFKIIGNKLPKSHPEGTFYVINEESELITTGKYIYAV